MKGLIALDLDGTTTTQLIGIPYAVTIYLTKLQESGWQICFVTGRSFTMAQRALSHLSFPYFLAVQNGALLLSMPEQVVLRRHYLSRELCLKAEELCSDEQIDFILYGGFEAGDKSYWRPKQHKVADCDFFARRGHLTGETWVAVDNFSTLDLSEFPSIKWFLPLPEGALFAKRVEKEAGLYAPIIRDPFDSHYQVIQATHPSAKKGQVVVALRQLLGEQLVVIAAGDDHNDWDLLLESDLAIAMQNAPYELLELADLVAPPASECGIIQGLQRAIDELR